VAPKNGGIVWETLAGDMEARKKLGNNALYAQSKAGNVIFSKELAKRYADQGIVSTSLNPGNLKTDLQRHVPSLALMVFGWMLFPAPMGAWTSLYAATSPEAADLNGAYLKPWARVSKARADLLNPEVGEKLWDWLEEQVKAKVTP